MIYTLFIVVFSIRKPVVLSQFSILRYERCFHNFPGTILSQYKMSRLQ